MDYERLLEKAHSEGLKVKERPLKVYDGRIKGDKILIRSTLETSVKKACVLSEELGHFYTSIGNIIDTKVASNYKQEIKARSWSYNNQVGLIGIVKSFENGITTMHDMAEYLNVTEDFLNESIKYMTGKYGVYTCLDNYIIYFIPNLTVLKMGH